MKKIIFLLIIAIFTLTNCTSIKVWSNYYPVPTPQKEIEKISLHGDVENHFNENSYLKEITLLENIKTPKKGVKLLEPEIIIETNQKYRLKNINKSNYIEVYNQGVKINSDTFTIYIGKVQLENGEIVNIPPIKFKRFIEVYKINKFLDTFDQNNAQETLFRGRIDEYREWKKKNMK